MSNHPIVGRQVIGQIISASGPVNVGKWDEITFDKDEVEVETTKPMDGSLEHLITGIGALGGTLTAGTYNSNLAEIVYNTMHPGDVDPPRLILLVTEKYNDGSTKVKMYKNVILTKNGKRIPRGRVTESVDWIAEDCEYIS